MHHRRVSESVRMILSPQKLAALRAHVPEVRSRPAYKRPGMVTGVFPIEPSATLEWIAGFLGSNPDIECDVFFSVTSSLDSDILELSPQALRLLQTLGVPLRISYTLVGPPDEEEKLEDGHVSDGRSTTTSDE
jgi:hypothetical protein